MPALERLVADRKLDFRGIGFGKSFLVPGVNNGFRGAGPAPTGMIDAVVRWVEEGRAPERLLAESRYP